MKISILLFVLAITDPVTRFKIKEKVLISVLLIVIASPGRMT